VRTHVQIAVWLVESGDASWRLFVLKQGSTLALFFMESSSFASARNPLSGSKFNLHVKVLHVKAREEGSNPIQRKDNGMQ
jgi:hypothetical protein